MAPVAAMGHDKPGRATIQEVCSIALKHACGAFPGQENRWKSKAPCDDLSPGRSGKGGRHKKHIMEYVHVLQCLPDLAADIFLALRECEFMWNWNAVPIRFFEGILTMNYGIISYKANINLPCPSDGYPFPFAISRLLPPWFDTFLNSINLCLETLLGNVQLPPMLLPMRSWAVVRHVFR